jgi:hypothetical protein
MFRMHGKKTWGKNYCDWKLEGFVVVRVFV